jgi:transposase InsO family protein
MGAAVGDLEGAAAPAVFQNTSAALQAALDQFTQFYNTVRPHQGLGGLTPEEA